MCCEKGVGGVLAKPPGAQFPGGPGFALLKRSIPSVVAAVRGVV